MSLALCLFFVAALSSNAQATSNEALQTFTSLVTSLVNITLSNIIECFEESNTKVDKDTDEFFKNILVAQREFSVNIEKYEVNQDKQGELQNLFNVSWSAAVECNVDFLTKFRKPYEEAANSAIQSFDVVKDLEKRYEGCQDEESGGRLLQSLQSSKEDVKKDLKVIKEKACEAVKKLEMDNKESCLKIVETSFLKNYKDRELEIKTNKRPKQEGFKGELAKFRDDLNLHLEMALRALSEKFNEILSINFKDCAMDVGFLFEAKSQLLDYITGNGKEVVTKIDKINNLVILGRIEVAKAFVVGSKNLTMLYKTAAQEAREVLKVVDVIEERYENCKGDAACVSALQRSLGEEDEKASKKLNSVVGKHITILEDVMRRFTYDYLEPTIDKFNFLRFFKVQKFVEEKIYT